MTDRDDDELRHLMRSLDPVASDAPPAQGSDRYRSILETAMHTDDHPTTDRTSVDADDPAISVGTRRSRRRRRAYAFTAAAAVLVIGVVGAVVLVRDDALDPQLTVSEAVTGLGEITSLEAELTRTTPESTGTTRVKVDGDAVQMTSRGTYADGHVEEATQTMIDGVVYETIAGATTRVPLEPGQGLAPFGTSSDAVLAAATSGSEIIEVGPEQVGDVEAVRYDIALSAEAVAALSALPPNQLGWFELEYPDQVDSLSVWIADGLVHQIEVVQGGRTIDDEKFEHPLERPAKTTRTRFFNFNGDIRVEAPPGPYVESGS